jgi:osmotically-inducible protein OsmY
MKSIIYLSLTALLLVTLTLQGCTPAVVGGGAAVGASAVHDRRTVGTSVEDQNIEIKALHMKLQDNELKDHMNVSVTSYNMVVLLTGQATSPEISERYANMVGSIDRVRRVVNEIKIEPSASFMEGSGDSYLTAKVKVKLFDIKVPGFDPTRVKVVTEKGVVYLMGLVSHQEADLVVEKVRNINGVNKVVKVFEYLTPNS